MISYAIKLRFNGTPLAGGKIEDVHSLPAGNTKVYQFKTDRPGFIQLEITKDIENGKEKKDEKSNQEKIS